MDEELMSKLVLGILGGDNEAYETVNNMNRSEQQGVFIALINGIFKETFEYSDESKANLQRCLLLPGIHVVDMFLFGRIIARRNTIETARWILGNAELKDKIMGTLLCAGEEPNDVSREIDRVRHGFDSTPLCDYAIEQGWLPPMLDAEEIFRKVEQDMEQHYNDALRSYGHLRGESSVSRKKAKLDMRTNMISLGDVLGICEANMERGDPDLEERSRREEMKNKLTTSLSSLEDMWKEVEEEACCEEA